MITVPQLDPVTTIADDDVIMITHANGTTEKITGANFKKVPDVYEQTRYDPVINTTYVKTLPIGNGVSVYKTRKGLKVLTGYFEVKANMVGGITDLFTFPEACRQTRPEQLWLNMISVATGKSYPLLMAGKQMGTWGTYFPQENEIIFIPPVTYL